MMRKLLIGFPLIFLAACSTEPVKVVADTPTVVTKTTYVSLPAALLQPCDGPVAFAQIKTNGDLLAAMLTDADRLTTCAARLDAVKAAQPKGS